MLACAYTIEEADVVGGCGPVLGYSHSGENAKLIAKGLSLAIPEKIFVVLYYQKPCWPVQKWQDGHQISC